ncbi:MAG: hypothetical protein A3G34_12610 [Candidatus Lindowbacteria bacterium RIFCSPLOWO2_12_FULL_62_27]|nr:MAG: hypothetical protein A3G34_12610 [Candidatus Lindowbacteria bacterium RIFCSPLOWO2_12_FULL_62_27]
MTQAPAVETKEKEATKSSMVGSNINTILRTTMTMLTEMEIADVRVGKARACKEGWLAEGYAVYTQVRGMIEGDVVLGMDPRMARQMVRKMLMKRFQVSDFEFRLAVQMLANDVLVSALDLLDQVNIRVSVSAPQVYSRFEWNKTPMSKVPMIAISLHTAYGVCQLAFHLRTA